MDNKVYDLVINSIIQPTPPPPPPKIGENNRKISQGIIDSLNNVPLKIAVSSVLIDFEFKNKQELSFIDRINNGKIEYYSTNKVLANRLLFGRNSLSLEMFSEEDINVSKIYDDYDGILKVSKIRYNDNKDKALVIAAYSVGKLSGNVVLFYLEKKNNHWTIIKKRNLSVS